MRTLNSASLFRRLMFGLMAVMGLLWLIVLAYLAHQSQARETGFTNALNSAWTKKVLMVAGAVQRAGEPVAPVIKEMDVLRLQLDADLRISSANRTRVLHNGTVLFDNGSADATQAIAGRGWVTAVEHDPRSGITVESRQQIIRGGLFSSSGLGYMLAPLAVSLPVLLLPAWLVIRSGLRPLNALAAAVEDKAPGDLAPFAEPRHAEIKPLVHALNRLMQRLEQKIRSEQQFLIDAAHELKTPLAVIELNLHLLDGGGKAPEAARHGLRDGIHRAAHAIHQLLDCVRVAGPWQSGATQSHDLVALVRGRLAAIAPLALAREVELALDAPDSAWIPMHRETIATLVDNLVSNASKYAPPHTTVKVHVGTAGGDGVLLAVEDEGRGIPVAYRDKVFERFFRIPGQDEPGSGLGLAIARQAAERHGAAMAIMDGANGRGVRVEVRFPAQRPG